MSRAASTVAHMSESSPCTLAPDPADAELLADQTRRLIDDASRLDAAELAGPSGCAGWTRAHVIAHLAGNAISLGNAVRTLMGTPTPMYASEQARDAAIEEGAGLAPAVLLERLSTSAATLASAIASLPDPAATMKTWRGSLLRADQIATLRLREVTYHHVDLDCGFTFADIPGGLAERLLADEVARLRAQPGCPSMTLRTDERDVHAIGDGTPTVSAPRAAMLAWLARGDVSGIEAPRAADLPTLPQHRPATDATEDDQR